eukprot:2387693-Alexandrium_andersonii.AAC.1
MARRTTRDPSPNHASARPALNNKKQTTPRQSHVRYRTRRTDKATPQRKAWTPGDAMHPSTPLCTVQPLTDKPLTVPTHAVQHRVHLTQQ